MNRTRLSSRTALLWLCALATGLGAPGCMSTEAPPAPTYQSAEQNLPGDVSRQEAVTISARVSKIDTKTREVVLLGPSGNFLQFRVDDSVENLDKVKQGDIVDVTYYRGMAIRLQPPGGEAPSVSTGTVSAVAKPGEMPASTDLRMTTMVATIQALDRANRTATLQAPDGSTFTIDVRNPHHFDVAKVGDRVEITYTEAVAVSVKSSNGR